MIGAKQMTQLQLKEISNLGNGVTRGWLHDGRIVVFTLHDDLKRHTMETWAEGVKQTLQDWAKDRPFLVIHHVKSTILSSHTRYQAEEASRAVPDGMTGRVVVVIPNSAMGHIIRLISLGASRLFRGKLETRIVCDFDEGLVWLEEML